MTKTMTMTVNGTPPAPEHLLERKKCEMGLPFLTFSPFDFVETAHARHSSNKFDSALV